MWQHAWKKRAFRHFRFACINLPSKMYKGSTFFDSTALQANSRSLFFHAFLIYSALSLFFSQLKSLSLWENLLFRCYLSRFFSQLMPWRRMLRQSAGNLDPFLFSARKRFPAVKLFRRNTEQWKKAARFVIRIPKQCIYSIGQLRTVLCAVYCRITLNYSR